jgi:hypothetical protein
MSNAEALDFTDAAQEARHRAAVFQQVGALVNRLDDLATKTVSKKIQVEDRWVKDLRQYHGRYEANVETDLRDNKKSRLFINETRSKTHAWEARLSDMLFPTDDDNWGIKPTPVPELMGAADLIKPGGDDSDRLAELMKLAKAKAKSMRAEIKDQLTEAQYNLKCRQLIHDSCKLGAGVMKGPVVDSRTRRKYQQVVDRDDYGQPRLDVEGAPVRVWQLVEVHDPRPVWERTDPWNYFPDMSARTVDEAEFHFERHRYTKKQLRKLARKTGFDKDSIRAILEGSPREQIPSYLSKLRDITATGQEGMEGKYHVWEYHGPIEAEELRAIANAQLNGRTQDDILHDLEDIDPLEEQEAVVWFCEGRLLKYGPPLLETGDPVYSVFSFEADDTNIFGFGVPFLMRDSQDAMNAAWRMTMDNAGLSVGPQIVVNRELVEPMNGLWDLEPRKLWAKTKNLPYPTTAFEAYHIDSRQAELANIIQMAQSFADDETNMPLIAQGELGSAPRQTAQGMSMLMNSVNVVFRRAVKTFDDEITVPNIRRAYDWNMAFSPKEIIKGDFEVDARGSSVLLVRELQAQNLMTMALQFSSHPVLGPLTNVPGMYRKLVQAHMLPADELVKSDIDLEIEAQKRAKEPPPPDPEMLKLEAQMNIETMKGENAIKLETMKQESAMISLAEKRNMTLEQLQAKLQVGREKNESDERKSEAANQSSERKLAAEITVAERHPNQQSGGSV